MNILLKIVLFLIVSAIGFANIAFTFHILQLQGAFGQTTDPAIIQGFFQNAMFAWIAGVIIGTGYFMIGNALKYVFLLAPMFGAILYGLKLVFLSA